MFDTKTAQFKEWPAPTPGSWPYDVTADKNGEAWSGGEFTDTVQRLNPTTGEFVEYLLPRFTNIRRVFVDRPRRLRLARVQQQLSPAGPLGRQPALINCWTLDGELRVVGVLPVS
jgi:hypothetical protein